MTLVSDEQLRNWLESNQKIDSIYKIPGDASTRSYYRVESQSGSFIAMKTTPFSAEGKSYPFLEVQKYLFDLKIDVPSVVKFNADLGFILLEDLGDTTLLKKLQSVATPEEELKVYTKCINLLAQLQAKTKKTPGDIQAFKMRFDFEKLMWEVQFTIQHFFETYLERQIKDVDKNFLNVEFGKICRELEGLETVFCHRDLHSRNIMCVNSHNHKDGIVLIDFQDARLGPLFYDLASLLRDSYYRLSDSQIDQLVSQYYELIKKDLNIEYGLERFIYYFDIMGIQRNFKAIGSFASFLNLRGNNSYLKYIGNTFESVRRTLIKYPELKRLREVLYHYYYF